MKTQDFPRQQACADWSNRILILSLLGIAYLTFFPFRFDFSAAYISHRYPFLLETSIKPYTYSGFFLNVLLFVPFGFGVCAQGCKRGKSRWTLLFLALIAGASASYMVELLQFYIPERDSGWGDVISNAAGSVAGFFLFELCGGVVLSKASRWERTFKNWLSPRRATLLLLAYFAVCFYISIPLQHETRLSNWDPQCILSIGNDASGEDPWRGQVFFLQVWNRALPEQEIRRIAGEKSADDATRSLLASYDFTNPPPYQDKRNFLPALGWTPKQPQFTNARSSDLDAKSWLRTKLPVENLTEAIKKSDQFTVRIVCEPAATQGVMGHIVSLSHSTGNVNFHLRQDGQFLVLWFRNSLTEKRSDLAWYVPDVFEAGKARDIVASYDGSDAFIYLDGNRVPQTYRLSPGAGFMRSFTFIQTADLEAYVIVYETLIFLPAGLPIGMEAAKWFTRKKSGRWMFALALILPAVLLEILLAEVSGRRIGIGNIALSLVFELAGVLLINADLGRRISSRVS